MLDIGSVSFSNIGAAIVQQGIERPADRGRRQSGRHRGLRLDFLFRAQRRPGEIHRGPQRQATRRKRGIGGAADFGLRAVLKKHGLVDKRDYTLTEAAFPTLVGLLLSGKADLVAMTAPLVYDPKLKANARALFNLESELGPIQQLVTAAREGFIAQQRATLVDFFEDYLISLQWFHHPANRAEAIRILANFTRGLLPKSQFAGWALDKGDFYHEPWARPNIPALQPRDVARSGVPAGRARSHALCRSQPDRSGSKTAEVTLSRSERSPDEWPKAAISGNGRPACRFAQCGLQAAVKSRRDRRRVFDRVEALMVRSSRSPAPPA